VVAHATESLLSAVIRPSAGELVELRTELREWLAHAGADDTRAHDIILAVHEAVANSVEHAYLEVDPQPVFVDGRIDDGEARIIIRDCGTWRPPWGSRHRGRGLSLMSQLVDLAAIEHGEADDNSDSHCGTGTTVTLIARIDDNPPSSISTLVQ
jgi:anti-sigma regulatory factor (Ser/Thr protein kinase)